MWSFRVKFLGEAFPAKKTGPGGTDWGTHATVQWGGAWWRGRLPLSPCQSRWKSMALILFGDIWNHLYFCCSYVLHTTLAGIRSCWFSISQMGLAMGFWLRTRVSTSGQVMYWKCAWFWHKFDRIKQWLIVSMSLVHLLSSPIIYEQHFPIKIHKRLHIYDQKMTAETSWNHITPYLMIMLSFLSHI